MIARGALRVLAIAIAVAGVFDPVMTVSRRARQPLMITILDSPSDAALDAAARVASDVSDFYDVRVRNQPVSADASPCSEDRACVVISDGVAPRRLTPSGSIGAIRVAPSRTPAAAIKAVHAPATVDPGARGVITVDVDRKDPSAVVRVFDGSVLVGESSTSRIEWTPVATGLRDLRIATGDDETHVAVEVRSVRHSVLLYESRPTWMATFVRRALEADPRFALRTRARVANAISVSTGAIALDIDALERADARVVVVSAVDQLTANEVAALDAFVRRRGGSVVALLDARPAGPARMLLPFAFNERRETQAVAMGPLEATEFLTLSSADAATTVLADAAGTPVIVSRAVGQGRIIASGASDAWRFRDAGGFTAYWQSLVANAADAAGDALVVRLDRQLARPHEPVHMTVDWRRLREIDTTIDARAVLTCGGASQPIRLWPDGAPGRFAGDFVPAAVGECRVSATLNNATASVSLLIRDVATLRMHETDLATVVTAHGGTVANAGDEHAVVTMLRRSASSRDISTQVHPMHSPLWIVPFALCLGGEWWLRRRAGRT